METDDIESFRTVELARIREQIHDINNRLQALVNRRALLEARRDALVKEVVIDGD